ncbi:AmmeMemoRadiSam system protein B [bacterium]|nr:AmmeMemoRadiSam system protein B [bacterium]
MLQHAECVNETDCVKGNRIMSAPDEIQDITHEMSNEVAGAFYPTDPAHLKRTIDTYLRESRIVEIGGKLRALMVPHAGYVFSGTIAATGYRLIRNLDQQKTWRIILLGLSHFKPFSGISIGAYGHYATPLGPVSVSPLAKTLLESYGSFIPDAHLNEHSIDVQLPFLKVALKHFEIVPILTSNSKPDEIADILEPHMDDSTLLIVSSDLSHMLPFDRAEEIDNKTMKWIIDGDEANVKKHGQACGLIGILAMITLSKRLNWNREIIGYATSANTHGERNQVVGYGSIACYK